MDEAWQIETWGRFLMLRGGCETEKDAEEVRQLMIAFQKYWPDAWKLWRDKEVAEITQRLSA